MTHDEARQYYENKRQDAAALYQRAHAPRRPKFTPSTDLVCPACGASLGYRKPPSRRSSFKCKKCGAQVHADPQQQLFPSVYLTETEKGLVDYLWQLDRWVFAAGTIDDFYWAKAQIRKHDKPNSDDVVTDVIWFLLQYNLKNLPKINPYADNFGLKTYREDITALIREFKEDQEYWRKGGVSKQPR